MIRQHLGFLRCYTKINYKPEEVNCMFKHILVPTDLTEKSLKALDIAVKMASQDVSMVTLLHVIKTIENAEHEEFEDFYEKLRQRAQQKMDEIVNRYQDEKLTIDKKITYGKRAREIVRFAQENVIDLIVLSSHKIDSTNSAQGFGTISYKVGILSHCPVMMVK